MENGKVLDHIAIKLLLCTILCWLLKSCISIFRAQEPASRGDNSMWESSSIVSQLRDSSSTYTLANWRLNVSWLLWQLCLALAYNFIELTSCIEKPCLLYGIDLSTSSKSVASLCQAYCLQCIQKCMGIQWLITSSSFANGTALIQFHVALPSNSISSTRRDIPTSTSSGSHVTTLCLLWTIRRPRKIKLT